MWDHLIRARDPNTCAFLCPEFQAGEDEREKARLTGYFEFALFLQECSISFDEFLRL